MRKLLGFFTGFVIAILLFGTFLYVFQSDHRLTPPNNYIRKDTGYSKFNSTKVIQKAQGKHTLLVMGSSEFEVGSNMKEHPKNFLEYKDFNINFVGAAGYQTLWHSIALGAIEGEKKPLVANKVVLFLSPQWFEKKGVKKTPFQYTFSEDNYLHFLQNKRLPISLKQKIAARVEELYDNRPDMLKKLVSLRRYYLDGTPSFSARFTTAPYTSFIEYKSSFRYLSTHLIPRKPEERLLPKEINWKQEFRDAVNDGEKHSHNPLYFDDSYYKSFVLPNPKLKGAHRYLRYTDESPEFEDLKLFSEVAKALGVHVHVIAIPFNGFWCDYTQLSETERQVYYSLLDRTLKKLKIPYTDFSSHEYEPYFFRDAVHIGWKGWIYVNQQLLHFARSRIKK